MQKIIFAAALALLSLTASPARAARAQGPQLSSARDQAAALQNESVGGPFTAVCDSSTSFGSNTMANCDSTVLPHNETSIAADPANPAHLVGSSNDTELPPAGTSGSTKSVLGFYTSFDGGGREGFVPDELHIDRAYLNSSMAEDVARRGGTLLCKPWRGTNGIPGLFGKRDFKIDVRSGTITCPAGQVEAFEPGAVVEFDPEVCGPCRNEGEVHAGCVRPRTHRDHGRR